MAKILLIASSRIPLS